MVCVNITAVFPRIRSLRLASWLHSLVHKAAPWPLGTSWTPPLIGPALAFASMVRGPLVIVMMSIMDVQYAVCRRSVDISLGWVRQRGKFEKVQIQGPQPGWVVYAKVAYAFNLLVALKTLPPLLGVQSCILVYVVVGGSRQYEYKLRTLPPRSTNKILGKGT